MIWVSHLRIVGIGNYYDLLVPWHLKSGRGGHPDQKTFLPSVHRATHDVGVSQIPTGNYSRL